MSTDEYHFQEPFVLQPFQFEKEFDNQKWGVWMEEHWHWSIYASIIYVITVYCGQSWMASRPPFRLKKLLIIWNLGLCIVSFFMFSRVLPYLWEEISIHGFTHAVCNRSEQTAVVPLFWYFLFTTSKILEFGDTLFIVARKQKLIFLHWYHHVTVAIYVFAHYSPIDPAGQLFGTINAFIHTLMYGYYSFKAMEIKVPRQLAKLITSLQISQMFIGLFVNLLSYYTKVNGERCDRTYSSIVWALLMYGSYFILFVQFFNSVYNTPKNNKSSTTSPTFEKTK